MSDRTLFYKYLGLPSARPMALEITHAEGIYLYGPGGKKYTDLVSGVSVSNVGHRHPAVIDAIRDQLDRYMHLMVYGEMVQAPQVRLAESLCNLLPDHINSVYYVNSGSEAIEGAMKLAKRYNHRPEVIAFRNAYHGGTQGALSMLGNESLKNAFRPLLPGTRLLDFNDFDSLRQITEKTACVIVESIQAEAGIILPAEGFLEALSKRCMDTGALLILDDIQMGFGRTGKLFSFEHFGFIPDILCLAKSMGGGMPVGAFLAPRAIMNTLTYEPELGHITTFGGHPVCCAAARASLEVITREGLSRQATWKGDLFAELLQHHKEIKEIRYKGLMMAVEIGWPEKMTDLQAKLLENGLIVDQFLFNHRSFRIAPPLTITREQIEETAHLIIDCLNEI